MRLFINYQLQSIQKLVLFTLLSVWFCLQRNVELIDSDVRRCDQNDLSLRQQACVYRNNRRADFSPVTAFIEMSLLKTSDQGIVAAQNFMDDLQAAACKCQSDMDRSSYMLLDVIMQELKMLKILATQVLRMFRTWGFHLADKHISIICFVQALLKHKQDRFCF